LTEIVGEGRGPALLLLGDDALRTDQVNYDLKWAQKELKSRQTSGVVTILIPPDDTELLHIAKVMSGQMPTIGLKASWVEVPVADMLEKRKTLNAAGEMVLLLSRE
jgi:hypothetical protein